MIFPGSNIDKFIEIISNSFQLKYKMLSEDEKEFLRKLLKKSPIVKNSGINFKKIKNSFSHNSSYVLFNFIIICRLIILF